MEEVGGSSSLPQHSSYIVRPAVSVGSASQMSVGIKYNKETHMKTGNITYATKKTVNMTVGVPLRVGIIVALVAGCWWATPSTRDHKTACDQNVGLSYNV